MRKYLPALFVFLFAVNSFSQQPTPTPSADDVVRISTNLIQVDVTVTDGKGNVITDLRRDEIEIFENGKKQDISGFSFVNGRQTATVDRSSIKNDKRATIIPIPGSQRPERVRRTIALVVDDLTLSFSSTYWVREALKKFVREQMQDGDLVAIIRTGAGIGALQQFTTDRQQLLAAVEKIKFNLGGSAKISTFAPITQSLKEELNGVKGTDGKTSDYSADIEREQNSERELNEFRGNTFIYGTLGALNFIVRGMSELPGRKSVVLLSDGISLVARDQQGRPMLSDAFSSIQKLVDHANRASVVFYTLDARGLEVPIATAEDRITDIFSPVSAAKLESRRNELLDTQDGLRYIARGTGGLAYVNQNDISKGIEKALDDQSYYLVAYEPDDSTFDPTKRKYNNLSIKVTRSDAKVRYRSGFFGYSEEQLARAKPSGASNLYAALSSPFAANDITLKFNPIFTAGEGNKLFVTSYLHFDAKSLTFEKQNDGSMRSNFEIAGISIGDNGVPVDTSIKSFTLQLRPEIYDRLLAKGMVYRFTYELKKAGPFQYRVAIRDVASNRVGSANQFVNVPKIKNERLALSGIVFEDASKFSDDGAVRTATDPIRDTALRQFRQGSVVRYGLNIYNAKGASADLSSQVKLYRDGRPIYEGPISPVKLTANGDDGSSLTTGLIRIGESLPVGDYIVQVIITDNVAKGRSSVANQVGSFEVVEK